MSNELLKDCINSECIITLVDNTTKNGKIIDIKDNWLKLESDSKYLINTNSIMKIQIINNIEPQEEIVEIQEEKHIEEKKEEKPINNTQGPIINPNTVILTHGDYWYRAYGDSAYILSYITNYKLYEDTQTKRPAVGFPTDSIDKVIALLRKFKINYYLKYEKEYKDYGEDNNFQKFLHHDLPFSYVKDNVVPKKAKGKFTVQYEGEEEKEYVIGKDISPDAVLTKKIVTTNIGDTFEINQYKIKLIKKDITYD